MTNPTNVREAERAAIVEWLRMIAEWQADPIVKNSLHIVAARIVHGDHLQPTKGE